MEAMVAPPTRSSCAPLSKWDPALLGAASTQYANLVKACELCLAHDGGPDRAYRLLLPMFAAVHEGRPSEVLQLGMRVRDRWSDADAPWRIEVLAVLATAAAIAGRRDDVAPLAATVIDDPAASDAAVALAERAWALAARADDPLAAARALRARRRRRRPRRFRVVGIGSRGAFEAGELDLAGDATPRSTRWPMCCGGDTNPTTCSWSCSPTSCAPGCCCGAATSPAPRPSSPRRARGRRRWASRGGRRRCCGRRLRSPRSARADGTARAAAVAAGDRLRRQPRGARRGCDQPAHGGGRRPSTSASTSRRRCCFAAVPRSTAITVLPELFPEAMAELLATRAGTTGRCPPPPTRSSGRGRRSTASRRRSDAPRTIGDDGAAAGGRWSTSPSSSPRATPGASASAAGQFASAT